MSSRVYGQFCALAQALDRVGERWTLLIIRELLASPARFRDLKDALPGVATNLLTQRLRDLENDGLLSQHLLPPPAGVNVYELTDEGRELEPVVHALVRFGWRYMGSAPYVDPEGPRSLMMALSVALPRQVAPGRPARIALRMGEDEIGVTVNERGTVAISLGRPPEPEATLELAYRSAYGLVGGVLTVRQGLKQGHIKAAGSPEAIEVLDQLLRQRAFPPAQAAAGSRP